jgi:carboxyl-terminal processing protease
MKRITLAVLLVAFATTLSPVRAATDKADDTYRYLDLFGAVFERVRASYVTKVTDKKLIESAINGMLQSLDPHSSYMNAESFKEMQVQTRGKFGGLGIEVTLDKGVVKVVAPIDDTPAAKAGLKAGDYITHIDGKPILGQSLRDAVKKMRGPVGSKITIQIRRAGTKPFDVTLTRAVITVKSVRSKIFNDIGYLRITTFSEQTGVGVRRALTRFKERLGDKLRGVVVDLRNNPGGLLNQAVEVADAFLDKGEIVSTRGREARVSSRFNAKPGDLAQGVPIVVLVNGGSASASEIVAGALQDHRRAIILGTKSFGKGSVQTIIPLGNHGAMRLTTARYYTPSGRSIQAKGIVPDILVEQATLTKTETPQRPHEADLPGALDTKKPDAKKADPKQADPKKADPDKKSEAKPGDKKPAKAADKPDPKDYQLARALDLLRGISLYRANQK